MRRPGRDAWLYIGRATVSHEVVGQTSRVGTWPHLPVHFWFNLSYAVVRTGPDKILTTFGEVSETHVRELFHFSRCSLLTLTTAL